MDVKWKPAAFDARSNVGGYVETVKGWQFGEKPGSFVYHRAVFGDKGWTVSDPGTGLAFIKGLPSRAVARQMVKELHDVVKRYERRYGLSREA